MSQVTTGPTSVTVPGIGFEGLPAGGIRLGTSGDIAPKSFLFNYDETIQLGPDETYVTQSFGRYQAPDRLQCDLGQAITGPAGDQPIGTISTVTIGDSVWIDEGNGYAEVATDDPRADFARSFCSNAWTTRAPLDPGEDFGTPFELFGVPTRYVDLAEDVNLAGVAEGLVFQKLEIWFAEDGLWPVAFSTAAIGPGAEMAARVGRTWAGAPDVGSLVTTQGAVRDLDNPAIVVDPPSS